MTLMEYLTNPAGKGSSILPSIEIKSALNAQYESLQSNIKHRWFIKNDRFAICHIMIPSKSVDSVKYDVIFEFDLMTLRDNELTINNAEMKCFSNCPSFVYTYAYAFESKGLLCPWLTNKYQKKVLTKEPNVRNSYKIISYERSLYLAGKFITSSDRNKLSRIRQSATLVENYVSISKLIASQEQIEMWYNINVKKKKEKELSTTSSKPAINKPREVSHSNSSTNYSRHTPSVKTTAKAKTVKKSKKI